MKRLTQLGAMLTLILGLFGSCLERSDPEPPSGGPSFPAPPATAVGTIIATWDEGQHDRTAVEALVPDGPGAPVLLTTPEERDAWVAEASTDLNVTEVADIDMATHVVIVAGDHRCGDRTYVDVEEISTAAGTTSALSVEFLHPDEEIMCVWAPFTVEAWAIDRAELSGEPALDED